MSKDPYEIFQGKEYCEFADDGSVSYSTYQGNPLEPEGWYYVIADDPVGPFVTEDAAIIDAEDNL